MQYHAPARVSRLHIENMIKPCDPEKLHQLGIDMADREMAADGIDPFFKADQSTQDRAGDEMNVAQIQDQMIAGFQCNRIEEMIQRVSGEQVFGGMDNIDITQVFPGEPL